MPGIYNYWLLVTFFESSLGKKETHMFYVASVIKVCVFSDVLWKSTLPVRYKLNRFRLPLVNYFDICALLFLCYISFIPLDKMVLYG